MGLLKLIADQFDYKFLIKDRNLYLDTLFKAILFTGYFSLLRIGEMTEAEGDHTLKFSDVHIEKNGEKVLIILRSSKTHTKTSQPQLVKIS